MHELREVTNGLAFPEGPVAMRDGSVIVTELFGPGLVRVDPDGRKQTVAEASGSLNGAAVGPDGSMIVCNSGGRFTEARLGDLIFPGPYSKDAYIGGRIQTIDLGTGEVTDLYTESDGHPLWAPNDLVMDAHGGFYFTDHGLTDNENRVIHQSGIHYAKADGSEIHEVVFPVHEPNGIGLSPDDTKLYWAETMTGRLMQRDITSPGVVAQPAPADPSACLYGFPGLQLLDSLAVDSDGNVCVATLVNGGISVVSPAGELIEFVPTGDILTTNICFGGEDLCTAYITASSTGRLLTMQWPRPGAKLHHLHPGT